MIPLNVAIEDELSEAVLRRLLESANRGYAIGTAYGRSGFGYLKKTIPGWNAAAGGNPFAVMTDLDQHTCPPQLLEDWFHVPKHPNLIFIVAVREIESWLLADSANLADFLNVSAKHIPNGVEGLNDPKGTLINIARRSRKRSIKDRIVPRNGSTAQQGPDYNGCLIEFATGSWNIGSASLISASLHRAIVRLQTFTPRWS
ncbi:MAG: hypothetical protein ABI811_00525 [Acidobacteriota bacterium]